jgi:hypothetical protein
MLRFGESSRSYILCGPAELMPEEGPSKEDRMKQAALKVRAGVVTWCVYFSGLGKAALFA